MGGGRRGVLLRRRRRAQGSHAQHAQPWTESLTPALVDAINSLDWAQVHRALIPNAWNRVRLGTFTETWAVFGVWPPSDTEHDEVTHGTRGTSKKRRVMLEAYGDGGLDRAMARLRPDDVQYIAMRVTNDAGEARFIAAAWLGPASDAFIREPEGGGGAAGHASTAEDGGAGGEDSSNLDAEMPEGMPADADPNARWRKEWAAVRHYLAGAHAYVAVDGREFVNGGAEGADTAVRMRRRRRLTLAPRFGPTPVKTQLCGSSARRTTTTRHRGMRRGTRPGRAWMPSARRSRPSRLTSGKGRMKRTTMETSRRRWRREARRCRGSEPSSPRPPRRSCTPRGPPTSPARWLRTTPRVNTRLRATEAAAREKSKALKERLAARARTPRRAVSVSSIVIVL